MADGAAVIPKLDSNLQETDGYFYCSNSETVHSGGVGCLELNANHDVVGYEWLLSWTRRNCGGGRSPWNTWLSCEESGSRGRVHEVDPNHAVRPGNSSSWQTDCVDIGGNYESIAWWLDADQDEYHFFTTEDSINGALVMVRRAARTF